MEQTLLQAARIAIRRTGTNLDAEITELIRAAIGDMRRAGIHIAEGTDEKTGVENLDPLILRAVMLYAKANFGPEGSIEHQERFERCYKETTQALAMSGAHNGSGGGAGG